MALANGPAMALDCRRAWPTHVTGRSGPIGGRGDNGAPRAFRKRLLDREVGIEDDVGRETARAATTGREFTTGLGRGDFARNIVHVRPAGLPMEVEKVLG